jgi:hypothetical protein
VLIRDLIRHDGFAQLLQDGQEHAAIQRQDQVGLDTELVQELNTRCLCLAGAEKRASMKRTRQVVFVLLF